MIITVPEDPDVLPVKELLDFMATCNKSLDDARKAQQGVTDYIKQNEENQVMFFYRDKINGWLNQPHQWRRHHLTPLNPTQYMWDVECENFDRDLQRLCASYDKSLDRLYDILTSDDKREKLGNIGVVLDGWGDPKGIIFYGAISSLRKRAVTPIRKRIGPPGEPVAQVCSCYTE